MSPWSVDGRPEGHAQRSRRQWVRRRRRSTSSGSTTPVASATSSAVGDVDPAGLVVVRLGGDRRPRRAGAASTGWCPRRVRGDARGRRSAAGSAGRRRRRRPWRPPRPAPPPAVLPRASRSRAIAQSSAESVGASSRASAPGRGPRPVADATAGQPATAPLWLNSHGPDRNGAAAACPPGIPTVADRTAASSAPRADHPGQVGEGLVAPRSGRPRGAAPAPATPSTYQPTPNPSAFTTPCCWRRGAHDWRTSECGGSVSSSPSAHRRTEVGEVTAHRLSPRRARRPGAAEAGEDLPADRVVPVAERAPAGHRVGGERAAAQHLVLGAEEHLRVLPVRATARNPGSRRSRSTSTPRRHRSAAGRPSGDAPGRVGADRGRAAGAAGRGWRARRVGSSSPQGYRRDRPVAGSCRAAFSHSASVGSRRPAQRA